MIRVTAVVAFSWCYFVELTLDVRDTAIPSPPGAYLFRMTGAKEAGLGVGLKVRGPSGYEVSTDSAPSDIHGVRPYPGSSTEDDRDGSIRIEASGQFGCWPIPPNGPLEVLVRWPAGDIDEVIAQLTGEAVAEAASRSVKLDYWDKRPVGRRST